MSRKSRIRGGGDKENDSDNGRPLQEVPALPFVKILKEVGIVMRPEGCTDNHEILDQEPLQLVRSLNKTFQRDLEHPKVAKKFSKSLLAFLDKSDLSLSKALAPTLKRSEGEESELRESLIRILLQVDDVQTDLLLWLLDKMSKLAVLEDSGGGPSVLSVSQTEMKMTKVILSHLRMLSRIVNSESVSDKVIEILQDTPIDFRQELIASLAEIVPEDQHSKMAMYLRNLMKDKPELTNSVLHAFSNLDVKLEVLDEVKRSVLKNMYLLPKEDLPIVVSFLLDGLEKVDEYNIVKELRDQINFAQADQMSQLTQGTPTKRLKTHQDNKDVDTVLMYQLKTFTSANKGLADSLLKVVENAKTGAKTLDILILVILHGHPKRARPVEALFKNKVRMGVFTEDLIHNTLKTHGNALKDRKFFDSLTAIIEILGQSNEPMLSHMSMVLSRECFLNLDKICRQEVIGDVVCKCVLGTSGSPSRETALKTLHHLSFEHTKMMEPYFHFVERLLDHKSSTRSLMEFRTISDILFHLAYNNTRGGGGPRNNLHIYITKLVSSINPKMVRMGVTGAIMAVKNMREGHSTMSQESEVFNKAIQTLEAVKARGRIMADVGGLYMDELSNVFKFSTVDELLQNWIGARLIDDFTAEFVLDVDRFGNVEGKEDEAFVPSTIRYQLWEENDNEDLIAIPITDLVSKHYGIGMGGAKCTKAQRLAPNFRLMRYSIVSGKDSNTLSDIDALLICPLILPKKEVIDKIESLNLQEKNVVCASLFLAVNWFREVINAFADHDEPEIKTKVLNRLRTLLEINEDLQSCLCHNLTFTPTPVLHLDDVSGWQTLAKIIKAKPSKGGRGGGKGGVGKGRKRKADPEPSQPDASFVATDARNQEEDRFTFKMDHFRPFLRELDLSIFEILTYDVVTMTSMPPMAEENKNPRLRPPELAFLLQDLTLKLSHRLISKKSKRIGFSGKTSNLKDVGYSNLNQNSEEKVVEFVVKHFDHLLANLEELSKYFRRLIELNDGVMDANAMFNEKMPLATECFQGILTCLNLVLSWGGFQSHHHVSLLKEALLAIASRKKTNIKPSSSTRELAIISFAYLADLQDSILFVASAHTHLTLLDSVFSFCKDEASRKSLAQIAEAYLSRHWMTLAGGAEKGSNFNLQVHDMLKVQFAHSDTSIDVIEKYAAEEMGVVVSASGRDAASDTIPTLNKNTFLVHFKIILEQLVVLSKELSPKSDAGLEEYKEALEDWQKCLVALCNLVAIVKEKRGKGNTLLPMLKNSRLFLDNFNKNGMICIDKLFTTCQAKCLDVVKLAQSSTRPLQHFCEHSKIHEAASARHVPALKKAIETFVYKVKALLANNQMPADVFWLGTLKTKDIEGNVIESQVESTDQEDENEDEALPSDEESEVEVEQGSDDHANDNNAEEDMSMAF